MLVKAQEVTEDVLEMEGEQYDAIIINYRNYGYCGMRFDEKSKKCFIDNLRYMT